MLNNRKINHKDVAQKTNSKGVTGYVTPRIFVRVLCRPRRFDITYEIPRVFEEPSHIHHPIKRFPKIFGYQKVSLGDLTFSRISKNDLRFSENG